MKILIGLILILSCSSVNSGLEKSDKTFYYKGQEFTVSEFRDALINAVRSNEKGVYSKRVAKNAEKLITDILINSIRNDLDPVLVMAVIHQESRFNSEAKHPVTGAYGSMQIMKIAIKDINQRIYKGDEELSRYDHFQNIQAGTIYLKYLIDRFGETKKALIAYNSGPEYVKNKPKDFKYNHNYYNKIEIKYNQYTNSILNSKKNNKTERSTIKITQTSH